MPIRLLVVLAIPFLPGCSGNAPAPTSDTLAPAHAEPSATSSQSVAFSGHALVADAEYYLDGPQQSRPPDGTLKAGTKVKVIEDAGSYCRVQTEDGIVAFIAADAITAADPGSGRGGRSEEDSQMP